MFFNKLIEAIFTSTVRVESVRCFRIYTLKIQLEGKRGVFLSAYISTLMFANKIVFKCLVGNLSGDPARLPVPACWAIGTKELKKCTVGKTNILDKSSQGRTKIYFTGTTSTTNQARKDHFICPLWVPIHVCFNSQQGPPLSSLSGQLSGYSVFLSLSVSTHSPFILQPYRPSSLHPPFLRG